MYTPCLLPVLCRYLIFILLNLYTDANFFFGVRGQHAIFHEAHIFQAVLLLTSNITRRKYGFRAGRKCVGQSKFSAYFIKNSALSSDKFVQEMSFFSKYYRRKSQFWSSEWLGLYCKGPVREWHAYADLNYKWGVTLTGGVYSILHAIISEHACMNLFSPLSV